MPTIIEPSVTISGTVKVSLVRLGEGLNGDYDPNDPNDVELYRLDVLIDAALADHHSVPGEPADAYAVWFYPDGGSVCTAIPVTTDPDLTRDLLAGIAEQVAAALTSGGSVRRTVEAASWISPNRDNN